MVTPNPIPLEDVDSVIESLDVTANIHSTLDPITTKSASTQSP